MPSNESADLEQRWLTEVLKLPLGRPFAHREADLERQHLPEYFIEITDFNLLASDRTVILYAGRGAGKSALRIQLASNAAPQNPLADYLAVEFTDFGALLPWRGHPPETILATYLQQLIRAALKAILTTALGTSTEQSFPSHHSLQAQWAAQVPPSARPRLAQLIRTYAPEVFDPVAVYGFYNAVGLTFPFAQFIQHAQARQLTPLTPAHPSLELLAQLHDAAVEPLPPEPSPAQTLARLLAASQPLGFRRLHFLLDRLDEHPATMHDPVAQAEILEPLLGCLPVLETPGVFFKFFISREARQVLRQHQSIRPDRAKEHALGISWSRAQLADLLEQRLKIYSVSRFQSLSQLFEPDVTRTGQMAEDEITALAYGSPRRLLLLGDALFDAHFQAAGPVGRFTAADWEAAKHQAARQMPVTLRVARTEPKAYLGEEQIAITEIQHKLLIALAQTPSVVTREALIQAGWGNTDGVTEATLDQQISRLRQSLGDPGKAPRYLHTERGRGFYLANAVLED